MIVRYLNAAEGLSIGVGGYVNVVCFYDSRNTVSAREGHFLLWPADYDYNPNGVDVNAGPGLNILAIQSRVNLTVSGQSVFGARTSGMIEGDFLGLQESDINGFRLRHAYLKFTWDHTAFLIGQYWNPMFVTHSYPSQISSNAGVPFQPFARNPQLRLTHTAGSFRVLAALLSQRDYTSIGPNGPSSSYLRDAVLPDLHLQLHYERTNSLVGIGGEYKQIKPRVTTSQGIAYEAVLPSYAILGFSKLQWKSLEIKFQGVYGQNLADMLMLGGYGLGTETPSPGIIEYVNVSTASGWIDLSAGDKVSFGLFAGYTQNLGASREIQGTFYGRGVDIRHIYRVAPRVNFQSGNTRCGLEFESTKAGYGRPDSYGRVKDVREVTNFRILLATYYYFNSG